VQSLLFAFCSSVNSIKLGYDTDKILFLKEIFIKSGKNMLYFDIAFGINGD
jgi:hypothetical protein